MRSRNKSKKRKDSKEKITLQFVLLAVHAVNGKCDRLVLAVITRRDTDYRLSATQPVQSCCWWVHTCRQTHTITATKLQMQETQRKSPSVKLSMCEWLWKVQSKVLMCCIVAFVSVCVCFSTFQLKHRLVCVADSRVRLEGCVSGAACKVWITLEGALMGLEPTMFTCCILNLVKAERTVKGAIYSWLQTASSVYLSWGVLLLLTSCTMGTAALEGVLQSL